MKRSFLRLATAGLFVVGASACSSAGAPTDPGAEQLGTSAAAITPADAISRAEEWVTAKLLYCQSPNGANDSIDPSCPAICKRTSNAEWDPYRSDCSGLVSWAWGLPAPGRTTAEFAPNQDDITSIIDASTLQEGDAVNTDDSISSEHHVMLFKAWTVAGKTATFIEEPGCSATPDYAHEFTSDVTLNGSSITVAYNGFAFTAIRYGALGSGAGGSSSSGAAPPSCTVNGVTGTCIDTSQCATMAGYVATPGFCPGPDTEQCCTATGSAGSSSSGGTGNGGASGAGGAGHGGSGGEGASPLGTPSAHSGCQASPAAPAPAGAAGILAGMLLLRRRRRASASS
jgi:uncharacterized protein (TIGR03382 family)